LAVTEGDVAGVGALVVVAVDSCTVRDVGGVLDAVAVAVED
jgi:hypothetical protein